MARNVLAAAAAAASASEEKVEGQQTKLRKLRLCPLKKMSRVMGGALVSVGRRWVEVLGTQTIVEGVAVICTLQTLNYRSWHSSLPSLR